MIASRSMNRARMIAPGRMNGARLIALLGVMAAVAGPGSPARAQAIFAPQAAMAHSIWVDKSRQRVYGFEGRRLVFEAICSTAAHYRHWAPGDNEWEMPTTPLGNYQVFSKQPDHYSRAFQVHMRYALFYDGGRAIHATYHSEYARLGRPASGGCVRLTLSKAIQLYQWAHIGDPVHVVSGLPADLGGIVQAAHPRPVLVLTRSHEPAHLSRISAQPVLRPAGTPAASGIVTMPALAQEPGDGASAPPESGDSSNAPPEPSPPTERGSP